MGWWVMVVVLVVIVVKEDMVRVGVVRCGNGYWCGMVWVTKRSGVCEGFWLS